MMSSRVSTEGGTAGLRQRQSCRPGLAGKAADAQIGAMRGGYPHPQTGDNLLFLLDRGQEAHVGGALVELARTSQRDPGTRVREEPGRYDDTPSSEADGTLGGQRAVG